MSAGADQARASIHVSLDPPEAFRVFTEEIDRWWRRGMRYRVAGGRRGVVHVEPRVGGRLYESFEVGSETRVFATGEVTRWEPPGLLVLRWRAVNFTDDDPSTEVEVTFVAQGGGTLVTVTHRGWSRVRPDHPARHGHLDAAFLRELGAWWADLLRSFDERGGAGRGGAG